MKTLSRRLTALLLALAMGLSLLCASAWATQEEQTGSAPLTTQTTDDDDDNDNDMEWAKDDPDGDGSGEHADVDSVTEMTETVDGFVWSLTGGTLTVTGSGTLSTTPDWAYNAVMSKLVLGSGISGVGEGLFYDFTGLKEVSASDSLTSIGDTAFCNCTSLTSVDLGNVSSIGKSAFQGCTSLTSADLPSSLTSIGDFAFAGCSSLTSVDLPSSVSYVGESAFEGCTSLTSLSVSGNPNFDTGAFSDCTSLTNVDLGSSLTTLGEEMFYGCTSLSDITLPESVTEIGSEAFYGCIKLERIYIPASVESIGEEAFTDCSSKLIIFGKSGSAAEAFAKDNNITFVDPELTKLTLTDKFYTYNGGVQKPGISSVMAGDYKLGASDYEVVYSDENSKNKGTYKVTVKGRGFFTNTLKATYRIQPAELTKLTLRTVKYNGSVQNPVNVVKAGKLKLKRSDYIVVTTPKKAINAGSCQVTVTGKGNFHGTLTDKFTIDKANNTLRVIGDKTVIVSYNTLIKQNLTYKVTKAITMKDSGQGKLSFKKWKGHEKITIDESSGKITVKKGLKKGTYTVRIIITAAGDKNYKKASKTVNFNVWVKESS